MGEDTSISESAGRADRTDDRTGNSEPGLDPDDVTPTVTTYEWNPTNPTCDVCSEPVERRWRDDDDMVCRSCKEW